MTGNIRHLYNFAATIGRIRAITPVGCTDTQVELVTTSLRDVHDNYETLWGEAGLSGSPAIDAYQFVRHELGQDAVAVCFGDAEEVPQSGSEIQALLDDEGKLLSNERIISCNPAASSWYVWNDHVDRTMGRDPFIRRPQSVADFFGGTVLYMQGAEFSRFDIVEYAAYRLGHTHSKGDRYEKRAVLKIPLLDQFELTAPMFQRPNVNYLLLSIVRDITSSSDILKFVQAVRRRI